MSFDGLMMAAVRYELEETLVGGRIEKIYQPLAREIVIIIHREKTKYRLLLSADARDARVHLTTGTRENPLAPPLFCMVLRKHLEGGRVLAVEQSGLERVLVVRAEAFDELGQLSEKKLVCEIMGKHSNIILVDPAAGIILDGINRYSYATSRHREVLPGRRYTPPPDSDKINPLTASEEEFRSALWDPDLEEQVEKMILSRFDGLSPQTCREIVLQAGLRPGAGNQTLGELELNNLWKTFRRLMEGASSGSLKPTVCYRGNTPLAFSAVSLTQYTHVSCQSGPASRVLDEFFTAREKLERVKNLAGDLTRTVRNENKKVRKKTDIYEDTLRKAEEAETYKIMGELITANLYQLADRSSQVQLVNYYDPDCKTVTVELNPQLSPADNAQAYFRKYAKARNSYGITSSYLEAARAELEYLASVQVAIDQAEDMGVLAEIRSELVKEGYIRPEPTGGKARKQPAASEPDPISVKSAEGFEILIGRNNRQNDYLTMKLARPEDLWLHVKDMPGSHVIVKNPQGDEVPDPTLQAAAEAAAYHSRARDSSKVPVDYTLRKHVRKPKGAKPGMVIYDNQKTVFVEPKKPS